jgi:ATP-binding cassette subfamily B protein
LFLIVVLLVIGGEFFIRLSLYYVSQIVETISLSDDRDILFNSAILLSLMATGAYLLHRLCYEITTFVEARFLPHYAYFISKDLFSHVHKHSTSFFAEEMAGNVAAKIQTIIMNSYQIYYNILWGFIYPAIGLTITFTFIAQASFSLSVIMLLMSILYIFVICKLTKRLAVYSEKRSKASSESEGILVDSISNASLVKSFSNYFVEKKRYLTARKAYVNADRLETIKYAWFFVWQGLFQSLIQITFFIIPVWYWYKSYIDIAQFVLIQSLITMVVGLKHHFSQNLTNFFKLYGGINDGLRLITKTYDVVDSPKAKDIKMKKGKIDFDNITYHYKGAEPLFKDFSLNIKAGEKIGLVGHSGSGKSTLVKILSRYYNIQKGKILIDEQNISKVTQSSLRKNIALIPQDPSLFNRTIMENIRYGNLTATDKQVKDAAKKAYIHDFIMSMPQGYQSKVGERGVMLSGGERQRIAIARAILKNAPILILDEATSALDSSSEKYIQDSMRDLMKGKTVIAIAHRLSTLKEMDKIIVMDKGKIVETGTHATLLRKKGLYHKFYEMQSQGFLGL